jgi:serine/threonine protein kinase
MSEPTPEDLLTLLQGHGFLSALQARQPGGGAAARSGDTRALTHELVERNWITSYQANQLLQGHGAGLILGPYRILDMVGEGGMGQVFKAHHPGLDRLVALKIIPRDSVSNPVAVERFRREVRAVAKLSHPNIVTAFDTGQSGKTHYLAMEYLDGIDLARLVQQSGPLPVRNACQYVRQAAMGLQHAHERGLVHRDIKPSNLMVIRSGPDEPPVVKILDFGLARVQSEAPRGGRLTELGTFVGTMAYMAPEQAANARTADIRADIYSLGCSLYYLLTGDAPLGGSGVVDRNGGVMGGTPSVRKSRPEVSHALERVLLKMMASDPADRFQTPGEVALALEPHTRDEKQMRPPPVADRPPVPIPAAPARSPWDFHREGGSGVRRPPRRAIPGWIWLAGCAAAVVVVAVLLVLLVRNGLKPMDSEGNADSQTLSLVVPSATVLPGLLAYWPFEEGEGDSPADVVEGVRGRGHNIEWVDGVRGKAIRVKGKGSHFDFSDHPRLNFAAGADFTFCVWVRTRQRDGTLVSNRARADETPVIDLQLGSGVPRVRVGQRGGDPIALIPERKVTDGTWHHVAITQHGADLALALHLDGMLEIIWRLPRGNPVPANLRGHGIPTDLRALGAELYWQQRDPDWQERYEGGPRPPEMAYFVGDFDEFCVFGRVLSNAEIRTLAGKKAAE